MIGADFVAGQQLGARPRRQSLLRPRPAGDPAPRAGGATRGATRVRLSRHTIPSATASSSSTPRAARCRSRKSRRTPKSNWAVTGPYFYDERAADFAAGLKPSPRGELEITDLNTHLSRSAANCASRRWAAASPGSTPARRIPCSKRPNSCARWKSAQGFRVACPEEIAFVSGWISERQLQALAEPLKKSGYGAYLAGLTKAR